MEVFTRVYGKVLPCPTVQPMHACTFFVAALGQHVCIVMSGMKGLIDQLACQGLTLKAVCQENMRNSLRASINTGRRIAAERRLLAANLRQCLHKRLAERCLQQH